MLCEMRFYVPNNELDNIEENKEKDKKEEKKKEKKPKKDENKMEDGEDDDDESDDDEAQEITPAKVLNDKIVQAAGIGEFAGEVIASLADLPMIIPRGKYSLDLYSTFLKLHGRTHDYKILYKDINKGFLLPKPDGAHMAYIIHLKTPLRQGQTLHHFIALQFDRELGYKIKVNLSPEQIKENYGDELTSDIEGPLYDVLSKLFKSLIKINILIPGEFRSHKGEEAVKCSVKASDGHLYPLKNSMIFIHKPVIYIKLQEIKYVEFSRVGQSGMPSSRSFDITITKLKDDSSVAFAGIEKEEQKNLMDYFKTKNVKVRILNVETNTRQELQSDEDDDDEEESKGKSGKGQQKGSKGGKDQDMDDYDSESEDEDFNENESPEESEEGSDEDESMADEELDKNEIEDLQAEQKRLKDKKAAKGHKDKGEGDGEKKKRDHKDKKHRDKGDKDGKADGEDEGEKKDRKKKK